MKSERSKENALNVKSPIKNAIGNRQFIQKTETTHTLVTDSTGAYFLQSQTQTQSMISNDLEEVSLCIQEKCVIFINAFE